MKYQPHCWPVDYRALLYRQLMNQPAKRVQRALCALLYRQLMKYRPIALMVAIGALLYRQLMNVYVAISVCI